MKSWICPVLQGNKNLIHQCGVRASGEGMLLRFTHLGRSHHLHRFCDLRGVADRFDPAPYVLRVRHLNVWLDYRQVVLNSSSAAFICASRSLSSSFFSRIVCSKLALRVCRQSWSFSWYSLTRSTGTGSIYPFCIAHITATCSSTEIGLYCFCLNSSTMRCPRSSRAFVAASRSDPNCANAASSRNCARSSFTLPATCLIALIWAAEPTRLTESPTEMAGRMP